ncbi:MAG: hypothetical protein O2929_04975 [Cyanobacteria bacterium]|nr:hypothetical protein [Cyanobacteriota bacterium]
MALLPLVLAAALPAEAKLPFIGDLFRGQPKPKVQGPSAPELEGSTPEAEFQELLKTGDLRALNLACQEATSFDFVTRLQLLQQRLLTVAPPPQPFPVVLVNANALLSCRAPDAALEVLNRFGPAPGLEREQWLVQRWRAAMAGLHHDLAARLLEQLTAADPERLETLALPVRVNEDGTVLTRPALDLYVEHLIVLERHQEAAALLLAGRRPGQVAAERLSQAVALLGQLPLAERDQLMERALDQAAAAQAWGLAIALLEQQRVLIESESGAVAERSRARLSRLSQRLDDAYSEWAITRQDSGQSARADALQQQLRSPRDPGGHAAPQP